MSATPSALVVITLRGGLDALNAVVPYTDDDYHRARPTIGLARRALHVLDDRYGLHPALAPLVPLYENGSLGILHGVGWPGTTHSHFEAWEEIECGGLGPSRPRTGWLGRWLRGRPSSRASLQGLAFGRTMPRLFLGATGVTAAAGLDQLTSFDLPDPQALRKLYETSDLPGSAAALQALDTLRSLTRLRDNGGARMKDDRYPKTLFGRQLAEAAAVLRAGLGVAAVSLSLDGFDTHVAEGGETGPLARLLGELAAGLAAFAKDLGPRLATTAVVALSEFGRRVAENGSGGTDHGQGGVLLALGGGVAGGRVHGHLSSLRAEDRDGPGDVRITTDFRDALTEITGPGIFPGHWPSPVGLFA